MIVEFYGLTDFFNRSINDPVIRIAKVVFFDFSGFLQQYQNVPSKDMADGIALTIANDLFASETFLGNPQTAMNEALHELGSWKDRFFHDRGFRTRVNRNMELLTKMDAFRFVDFKNIQDEPTGKATA